MQADADKVGQPSPDGSPDPVLIRDVLVPKDGIGCLLVDHDADVPGVGALNLVQLYRCTVVQYNSSLLTAVHVYSCTVQFTLYSCTGVQLYSTLHLVQLRHGHTVHPDLAEQGVWCVIAMLWRSKRRRGKEEEEEEEKWGRGGGNSMVESGLSFY